MVNFTRPSTKTNTRKTVDARAESMVYDVREVCEYIHRHLSAHTKPSFDWSKVTVDDIIPQMKNGIKYVSSTPEYTVIDINIYKLERYLESEFNLTHIDFSFNETEDPNGTHPMYKIRQFTGGSKTSMTWTPNLNDVTINSLPLEIKPANKMWSLPTMYMYINAGNEGIVDNGCAYLPAGTYNLDIMNLGTDRGEVFSFEGIPVEMGVIDIRGFTIKSFKGFPQKVRGLVINRVVLDTDNIEDLEPLVGCLERSKLSPLRTNRRGYTDSVNKGGLIEFNNFDFSERVKHTMHSSVYSEIRGTEYGLDDYADHKLLQRNRSDITRRSFTGIKPVT